MARNSKSRKPLPRKPGWRDVSDEVWAKVEPLLPKHVRSPQGGRPPTPHRTIFNGILYVLRTGCQWKMLPREYGSGSAAHEHFQKWTRAGIFSQLWKLCLLEYDRCKGIDWKWQSLDSVTVSAPVKGGMKRAKTRPIEESSARNVTSLSMARESRLGSHSREPTSMIRSVLGRRWTRSSSPGPRLRTSSSICAAIRVMTLRTSDSRHSGEVTSPTFPNAAEPQPKRVSGAHPERSEIHAY